MEGALYEEEYYLAQEQEQSLKRKNQLFFLLFPKKEKVQSRRDLYNNGIKVLDICKTIIFIYVLDKGLSKAFREIRMVNLKQYIC